MNHRKSVDIHHHPSFFPVAKKVKKVLKCIDGVFTATIDSQQHKVTVTGNVNVETLLKKLVRDGKPAEIWPESVDGRGEIRKKKEERKKENYFEILHKSYSNFIQLLSQNLSTTLPSARSPLTVTAVSAATSLCLYDSL
ncbi:hypothetical protein RYX36_034077 [Vicia faba]